MKVELTGDAKDGLMLMLKNYDTLAKAVAITHDRMEYVAKRLKKLEAKVSKLRTANTAGKASLDPLVRCDGCRFWESNIDNDNGLEVGICHRHPPQPIKGSGKTDTWEGYSQPFTTEVDWCGDHTPNAHPHGRAPARTVQGVVGNSGGEQ